MCNSHGAPPTVATYLPIISIIKVSRGRGPLGTMLETLPAILSALLGTVDGDVGWLLLAAARGCLPASWDEMKLGHLIVGGVRGGDAAQLLSGVPKKVVMFTLAWVLCTEFGSRACTSW
jgi:hypothetical protein